MLPLEEIKPSGSKSNMGMNGDKLEVTIIPVDEEAYSKTIMMPNSAMIFSWRAQPPPWLNVSNVYDVLSRVVIRFVVPYGGYLLADLGT